MPDYGSPAGICEHCGLPLVWGNGYTMHERSRCASCNLCAKAREGRT